MLDDIYFMKQALIEAGKAAERGEVPVGAVVVCKERIIARAHNLTETLNDVTAHAEMQAITAVSYTHLDVYKRQILISVFSFLTRSSKPIAMRWHKNWSQIKRIKISSAIFRIMNCRSGRRIWRGI